MDVLAQSLQDHGPFSPSFPPASELCQTLFTALQQGSSDVTFVEPNVRTDDVHHPSLQRYAYCESEEHWERNAGREGYMNQIEQELGSRAFRIYRLDLDHDADNGLDEIIYGEPASAAPHVRGTYAWVDIHDGDCVYRRSMRASLLGGACNRAGCRCHHLFS